MTRQEKIEALVAIQGGTPANIVLQEHVELYNTSEQPDIYYNDEKKQVDIEYIKKNFTKDRYTIMTTFDNNRMFELIPLMKKLKENLKAGY